VASLLRSDSHSFCRLEAARRAVLAVRRPKENDLKAFRSSQSHGEYMNMRRLLCANHTGMVPTQLHSLELELKLKLELELELELKLELKLKLELELELLTLSRINLLR
jgi:hypothetical protein